MEKPKVIEVFNDNGSHSHWSLVDIKTGEKLWSEDPIECKAQGYPVKNNEIKEIILLEIKRRRNSNDRYCEQNSCSPNHYMEGSNKILDDMVEYIKDLK
jgi:hypothetical protein